MTIKYGLQFFFFELTVNDGQNFLAGIVQDFIQSSSRNVLAKIRNSLRSYKLVGLLVKTLYRGMI
jgi:hypothetical protein